MQLSRTFSSYTPVRLNVLSSGGGVQSNAIICLMFTGALPRSDLVVMSDTERESSAALDYQREYMQPICDEMGIPYHIVKKSDYTDVDLYQPSNGAVLAGYFSELNGRKFDGTCYGKQPSYCSTRWKREVVERFLNNKFGTDELTRRGVDMWMGISIDEIRRVKITTGKWRRVYPLCEMLLSRRDAIQIVENCGLPTPPRSACWMCPNRHDSEWLWMRNNCPEDFRRACEHEREIQIEHPHLWLTKYGVPLETAPFDQNSPQLDFFCNSGMCHN